MRTTTAIALLAFALLAGCSCSVLVQVPPRVDLASHGTLGVVRFASNGGPGRIGEKYGVDAVFLGEVIHSDPKTRVKITDLTRLQGSASPMIRGDISSKLVETRSGASVWSSGAWATRQIGRVSVSAGAVRAEGDTEDPREAMLGHLTADFRAGTERRRVN